MHDPSRKAYNESRKRAVPAVKVIVFLLLAALALYFFRVSIGISQIIVALAGLILLINISDIINVWYLSRKIDKERNAPTGVPEDTMSKITNEFTFVSGDDGEWYERRVVAAGQTFPVQLRPEEKTFLASLPFAEEVIQNIEHVVASLYAYVSEQKSKFPGYEDEFDSAKIHAIDFVSKKEPDIAEITFEESPSGRIWGCVYRRGQFSNLGFDD